MTRKKEQYLRQQFGWTDEMIRRANNRDFERYKQRILNFCYTVCVVHVFAGACIIVALIMRIGESHEMVGLIGLPAYLIVVVAALANYSFYNKASNRRRALEHLYQHVGRHNIPENLQEELTLAFKD